MAACPSGGRGRGPPPPPRPHPPNHRGGRGAPPPPPPHPPPPPPPPPPRPRPPPGRRTSGILSALISRYRGRLIFRRAGRLTQSWNPSISPSLGFGISSWRIPPPGVIHCTP